MCTVEAATLLQAGGIVQGVGGFVGSQSAAQSTEFQAKTAENAAVMLDIQAAETEEQGAQQATQIRRQTSEAIAAKIASTAGAGIDIGGATAREVVASEAGVGIADELETRRNTKRAAWAIRGSAAAQRATAKALKKSAKIQRFVAPIAFLAPVLTGSAQADLARQRGTQ